METLTAYHRFLCRQRAACEYDCCCMSDPKVVRNVNGQDRVFCYEHDPENGLTEWHAELEKNTEAQLTSIEQTGNVPEYLCAERRELERRNAHDALLRQPSPDERDEFEGAKWRYNEREQ